MTHLYVALHYIYNAGTFPWNRASPEQVHHKSLLIGNLQRLDTDPMQRRTPLTFARFLALPENRSGLVAVQRLAARLGSRRLANPLYLHGPAGTGKSHLVAALIDEVTRNSPQTVVASLTAADLNIWARTPAGDSEPDLRDTLANSDLVTIEDVQHLRRQAAESVAGLFDTLEARDVPVVFTASVGPRDLDLPARLRSRLASGLVVGLAPMQVDSRLAFLQDRAARRQLAVPRNVLAWLAEHLPGSGRELEGALNKLEAVSRTTSRALDLDTVTDLFAEQVEASRPTVERIAARVSNCFQVLPRDLKSTRRSRQVLLPRQVGMYLARQLTPLSLEQIGDYFGGRDHSTVLHACRKVEQALASDPVLSDTVRQLHAELG